MKRIIDSSLVLAVVLTLAGLALLGWRMFFDAPLVWQVESVRVLPGDGPVVLGAHELGQHPDRDPAAAARQLLVESDEGRWWLADIGVGQPVNAPSGRRASRFVRRWHLAVGDRVSVGPVTIEVAAVSATSLELLAGEGDGEGGESGLRATWRNGRLDTGTTPFADCPREGAPWWRRHLDREWGRELDLFSLGGQVDCPRRWRLAGLPYDSLRVVWVAGGFWLAPGTAAIKVAMQEAGDSESRGFGQLQLPIGVDGDEVRRVTLGGSSYRLLTDGGDLILRPNGGNDVWPEDQARPPPRDPRVAVQYQLQRWVGSGDGPREWLQAHGNWFLAALLLSTLAVLRYLRALRRRRASAAASLVPASLFGLVLSLGMWLQPALDARWLFWMGWLGWAWSSVVLLEAHRLRGHGGALWLTAVLLTGSGAMALGQLAADGDNTRWLTLAIDHWGLWAVAGWGLGLLAPVTTATWRRLLLQLFESRTWPWRALRILLPGLLIALLIVQVALGYEQGIVGVQALAAAKPLLVFVLAFAGMCWAQARPLGFVVRMVGLVSLFGALAYAMWWSAWGLSPLAPLGLLLIALPWTMAAGPDGRPLRGGRSLRVLLLVVVSMAVTLAALAWLRPGQLPPWLSWVEHFQAWTAFVGYLHSGGPARGVMDLAASGGWWGGLSDGWDWSAWQHSTMRLPTGRNGFIAAFALYRFGAAAGLALLLVQLVFLGLLFSLGGRCARDRAGIDVVDLAGRGLSLVLYGLAWLFVASWAIAWVSVLGLSPGLPVPAQPMTWLVAGGSSVALFAYPALAFALAAAWSRPVGQVDR